MADLIPMTCAFCIAYAVQKNSILPRVLRMPWRQVLDLEALLLTQGFDTLIGIKEAANA